MTETQTEEYGDAETATVYESFPQSGDLSAVSADETIKASAKVPFVIKNITPNVYKVDGAPQLAKLKVRFAIDADGINGEGLFANKNLFVELITWVDASREASPFWTRKRALYKQFLLALGFDVKNPPEITEEFVLEQLGRPILADITRQEKSRKDGDVYVKTGAFENDLRNYRSAE